jgi:hypothetical protein
VKSGVEDKVLRCRIFDDFKAGRPTLLIWGDKSLKCLAGLLRDLTKPDSPVARFEDMPWISGEAGSSVVINPASQLIGTLRITRAGSSVLVHCELTRGVLLEFADRIDVLAAPNCLAGRQYLDVSEEQPIQIVVSKGEYPSNWPNR